MTMRTTVLRDVASGDDGWGGDPEPDWQTHLSDVPCRMYVRPAAAQGRVVIDGEKTAVIEDRRTLLPVGTDVTATDRLGDVTDRQGAVLFDGPMRIDAVHRRPNHLELSVEVIT